MTTTIATVGPGILERMEPALLIPLSAIVLGCTIAIVSILGSIIRSIMRTRAVEKTRREVAAYVAEGSISPADAVALLNAGGSCEAGGE